MSARRPLTRWGTAAAAAAIVVALLPASGATLPATCADPCVVQGGGAGFVPPAVVITSGGSVVWHGLDTTHVNREGTGVQPAQPPCFDVTYSSGGDSDAVRFDATPGGLTATTDTATRSCATAVALPYGAYAVPYFCVLHPATMRGVIVITP